MRGEGPSRCFLIVWQVSDVSPRFFSGRGAGVRECPGAVRPDPRREQGRIVGGCSLLSGSVRVAASRIGLVPQSADLDLTFPVSASEVVTMGLIAEAGWGRRITADMRRRVGEALERVNLSDRASHRFGTLSGGQRQRVLVARALVARPELVMMDEPFNGLDAPSRDIITGLIASLTGDGVGVVVSTHDLSLARDVCSRACVLASRLVALGPIDEALAPSVLARAYGSGADEAIAALS